MPANPRYANGHRRRELRKRLLAAGARCAWHECKWPSDWLGTALAKELDVHDERFPVVDEIQHVSRGGDPLARDNVRLLHRLAGATDDEAASTIRHPPPPSR